MTQRIAGLVSFLFVFAVLSAQMYGQAKPSAKKPSHGTAKSTAKSAPKPEVRPMTPFSYAVISSGSVPSDFAAFNPERVADGLASRWTAGAVKGEFETTATFEARKAAALAVPYLPNVYPDDLHPFVVAVDKGGSYSDGLTYTYDADWATVNVFAVLEEIRPNQLGAPNRNQLKRYDYQERVLSLQLSTRVTGRSEYTGRNAYGATVEVSKRDYESVAVAFDRLELFPGGGRLEAQKPAAQFRLDPERAARELPSLRALLVVKPVEPFVDYHFSFSEPTRAAPTHITEKLRLIKGELQAIVFYSGRTGEVFLRLGESQG